MRLQSKTAIIVGGGQSPGKTVGTGRAAAITFAREGARVLVVDADAGSAEETKAMIDDEGGVACVCQADITQLDQCHAFAQACVKEFGRIDILHNNAGLMQGDDDITNLDEETWDRIHAVNVKGMFFSCKAVVPHMYKQKSGVITNISSTAGVWSGDPYIAYNTSKAGVNGLTTALVIDCARHGVRVNAIMPGMIDTPFGVDSTAATKGLDRDDLVKRRERNIPLNNKLGDAWDVANVAVFLASDEARFVTGAIIPVDGGQLLNRN